MTRCDPSQLTHPSASFRSSAAGICARQLASRLAFSCLPGAKVNGAVSAHLAVDRSSQAQAR